MRRTDSKIGTRNDWKWINSEWNEVWIFFWIVRVCEKKGQNGRRGVVGVEGIRGLGEVEDSGALFADRWSRHQPVIFILPQGYCQSTWFLGRRGRKIHQPLSLSFPTGTTFTFISNKSHFHFLHQAFSWPAHLVCWEGKKNAAADGEHHEKESEKAPMLPSQLHSWS